MYRIRIFIIVSTVVFAGNSFSQRESLQNLTNVAVTVSPELKMLNAKITAATNRIEQNTNLPNPMLSLGLMNMPVGSFSFSEEPMTMKVVGLSQEFPFPGMLGTKADVNRKDVEIVQQEYYDSRNELIKKVSQSYYELQNTRKEIELTKQQIKLMQDISEVVKVKYSVSEASQQNLLRIDLELTNMSEMLSALMGEESEQLSTINSFLLRDTASPIVTDSFPKFNYSNKTVSDLIQLAEQNRPFLAGIKTAVEKAQLSESLAKYDYYPMLKLSAQYAFREQIKSTGMPLDNMVSVMLDVSIPLNYGGKVTSMVEETQSMQEKYQQQYSASLQMLEREFGMINAKLKSLKERIDLSENGSLIQANENLKSALTAYQVGEIDFMNVLEAQSSLYTIEKNIYRLKTDYLNQLAQIEFLTGTKLNDQL